jgi:hypothetical protein
VRWIGNLLVNELLSLLNVLLQLRDGFFEKTGFKSGKLSKSKVLLDSVGLLELFKI